MRACLRVKAKSSQHSVVEGGGGFGWFGKRAGKKCHQVGVRCSGVVSRLGVNETVAERVKAILASSLLSASPG